MGISTELIPPGLDCINPKFSNLLAVSSENAFTQKDKVSLATCTASEGQSFRVIFITMKIHKYKSTLALMLCT